MEYKTYLRTYTIFRRTLCFKISNQLKNSLPSINL